MNCEQVRELLPELLAGALDKKTEQETLEHLAWCEECRMELAFWAQVAEVAKTETEKMPDGLFAEIRETLAQDRPPTWLEGLRVTRRALGLVGSTCKLAFSMAGMNA